MPLRSLNHVPVQIDQWPIGTDLRSHVFVSKQSVEPGISLRLIGQRILLSAVRGAAQRISSCAVHADSDKVRKRLPRVAGHFHCLWRARAENRGYVGRDVLKDRVRCSHCSNVATRAGERHPRCGSVNAIRG